MPERLLNHTWIIRRVSPFSEPWDLTDLREIERNATDLLRTYVETRGRVERDGTYVIIEWISGNALSNHLFFDVRVADQQTAQVVLCCGESKTKPMRYTKVDAFDFCMVHGDRKTYEVILSFLETTVGCVVGNRSFRPTTVDLAHFLYDTIELMDETSSGQVDITFGLPRNVRNLDDFSVSIPRTCFERLMVDLHYHRPAGREMIPRRDDLRLHFIKAIQRLILQVAGIDVQTLPMIRVANSIAMMEFSGKFKMLYGVGMHDVLLRVKQMIIVQNEQDPTSGRKRKQIVEDDQGGKGVDTNYSVVANVGEDWGLSERFMDDTTNGVTSHETDATDNNEMGLADPYFNDYHENIEVVAI